MQPKAVQDYPPVLICPLLIHIGLSVILALNGYSTSLHKIIQADCFRMV